MLAFLLSLTLSLIPKVTVTPAFGYAPLDTRISVRIERYRALRELRLEVSGPDYEYVSVRRPRAALTLYEITLPAGTFDIRATSVDVQGERFPSPRLHVVSIDQ